jgi:hypothetical protein
MTACYRCGAMQPVLTRLTCIQALHNFADIKVTADPVLVFHMATLGWTRQMSQK